MIGALLSEVWPDMVHEPKTQNVLKVLRSFNGSTFETR